MTHHEHESLHQILGFSLQLIDHQLSCNDDQNLLDRIAYTKSKVQGAIDYFQGDQYDPMSLEWGNFKEVSEMLYAAANEFSGLQIPSTVQDRHYFEHILSQIIILSDRLTLLSAVVSDT